MTVKSRYNHRTHHNISADVEKIKAALFDTTQDLKGVATDMIVDSVASAKDRTLEARDSVADYTAHKPFKALGIALATGIVLGLLIKR